MRAADLNEKERRRNWSFLWSNQFDMSGSWRFFIGLLVGSASATVIMSVGFWKILQSCIRP